MDFFASEEARLEAFPVLRKQLFLGHGGVTILPRCVAEAMKGHIAASCEDHQEFGDALKTISETRALAARLIGAEADEIALLGPTSLGLSLFANGIDWKAGDEVICYADDYPSNVYPWTNLRRHGVRVVQLQPERMGEITPELVEAALTSKTRLVALATCHFLTGYRIDIDSIGRLLHDRGILFSLDGIQTVGAFPTPVHHADFLSADAHKWLLGPLAVGIVYVSRRHFETCRPTLLGAWNVRSPNFITQEEIEFVDSAQRYEPGVLNITGIHGLRAALQMILDFGQDRIAAQLLDLHAWLGSGLAELGFETISPSDPKSASAILSVSHPRTDESLLFAALEAAGITASLRHDRSGSAFLRFSPHFYNTREDMDRVIAALKAALPAGV